MSKENLASFPKISLSGNMVLSAADQIIKLCLPLQDQFNIPFFRYSRCFNDGSRYILCNQPDVMKFFYEDGYYPLTWHDNADLSLLLKPRNIIWAIQRLSDSREQIPLEQELSKYFQLSQGMVFAVQGQHYTEVFDFATNNTSIYNLDKKILNRFIYYFKDQAKNLLKNAYCERILMPVTINSEPKKLENSHGTKLPEMPIKRFYLNGNYAGIYLTDREVQCINWLMRGKTAEEIALLLKISKRTVELHIQNTKQKLNCYKQTQLITVMIEQDLIS